MPYGDYPPTNYPPVSGFDLADKESSANGGLVESARTRERGSRL